MLYIFFTSHGAQAAFSEQLCQKNLYQCITIDKNTSWDTLFPKAYIKDMVMRVNRMNTPLKPGMTIAVPMDIEKHSAYELAPFPKKIESDGEKFVYVSQKKLAWAAYDEAGDLIWWGPISPGKGKCPAPGGCRSPRGIFRIIRKQDQDCVSTAYPYNDGGETGGAPMPYCMHFYRGYALHGSAIVPGYADSHGCIRLFEQDAKWLNEEFVDLPGGGRLGTRVILD